MREGDQGGGGEMGEDEDESGLRDDAGVGVGEDAADGDGGVGDSLPIDAGAILQLDPDSAGTSRRLSGGDSRFAD